MQEEQPTTTQQPTKHSWLHHLRGFLTLLIAPICAVLLILFVVQTYQVSGDSMQNTLQNNDRLIVWKGTRTLDRLLGKQYVPKRGDIIIVNEPNLSACGQTGKTIIKRVIGLPGERVVYQGGHYTVYTKDYPNGFDPDTTLAYGKAGTALLDDPDAPSVDITLSNSQVFVSGDHRADSCDSRAFGPVQTSDIVGHMVARIFPLSSARRF